MSEDTGKTNEIIFPDLVELWKELYFKNESSWGEEFKEFITKETFVYLLDKTLDHYLSNEKVIRQNMDKYLDRSSFPSKKDIARVAEMVISVEDKVEVLDFELVQAVKSMADSMLNMADAQKKAKDELSALRKDIADLNKKIDRLDKKAANPPKTTHISKSAGIPKEPEVKSSSTKNKKKERGSSEELIP